MISTGPLPFYPDGNYGRVQGYRRESSICKAAFQSGIELGRSFFAFRTESASSTHFKLTYQNGVTGLPGGSQLDFWMFSSSAEKVDLLPKVQCDVMRHVNETRDFKVTGTSRLLELPGATNISTAWTPRLAISGSVAWPTDKSKTTVDHTTDLAFAWISAKLGTGQYQDSKPALTVCHHF